MKYNPPGFLQRQPKHDASVLFSVPRIWVVGSAMERPPKIGRPRSCSGPRWPGLSEWLSGPQWRRVYFILRERWTLPPSPFRIPCRPVGNVLQLPKCKPWIASRNGVCITTTPWLLSGLGGLSRILWWTMPGRRPN